MTILNNKALKMYRRQKLNLTRIPEFSTMERKDYRKNTTLATQRKTENKNKSHALLSKPFGAAAAASHHFPKLKFVFLFSSIIYAYLDLSML